MANLLKRRNFSKKDLVISAAITFSICILPTALMVFCWSMTKFPPQIFGNNEDHFRGHVISPIPESVEILNVEFDDLIIHPDVTYYFQFLVSRNDLEKIISYRSLAPADGNCSGSSYPPEWWDVISFDDIEKYESDNSDGLIITLCYHVLSKTAYYMFLTY